MLLDGSILDLADVEAKIKGFLASGEDVDSNVQQACAEFEIVLASVLRSWLGTGRLATGDSMTLVRFHESK